MAIPWKLIGKYALQFAEYALAQRFTPQAVPAGGPMPVPIPAPAPPVVVAPEPTPAPVLTLAQKWEDAVQDLATDILGYVLTDPTELRGYEKLMDVGRRDEVVRNLIGKLPPEQQAAKRLQYGV